MKYKVGDYVKWKWRSPKSISYDKIALIKFSNKIGYKIKDSKTGNIMYVLNYWFDNDEYVKLIEPWEIIKYKLLGYKLD